MGGYIERVREEERARGDDSKRPLQSREGGQLRRRLSTQLGHGRNSDWCRPESFARTGSQSWLGGRRVE